MFSNTVAYTPLPLTVLLVSLCMYTVESGGIIFCFNLTASVTRPIL
jgi:hypothetical protein